MRRVAGIVGLALSCILAGCGEDREKEYQSYRQLVQDQIAAQEEFADVLESIKTPQDMAPAYEKLKKINRRLNDLSQRAANLGNPPEAVQKRLQEDLVPRLQLTFDRRREEAVRIIGLPGGEAFLDSLKELPKN